MPLTAKEAFKAGFLMRVAEAGLSRDETLALVKSAREKLALPVVDQALDLGKKVIGKGIDAGSSLISASPWLLAGGLATIPAAAYYGGHQLASLADTNELDEEEARQQEVISELERLRDQALTTVAAKRYRQETQRPSRRRLV